MSDFLIRTFKTRRYAVYRPPDYTPSRKWPLILFLHGAGESGDDGVRPTKVGLGPALAKYPERYGALVVFPQCPLHGYWQAPALSHAIDAMEATIGEEAVDESRLYLTGVSMGGFGSFLLATFQPDRFAALAPICGGGQAAVIAPILARIPLWIFHGAEDPVVPVEYSRAMVEAIRLQDPVELRYTEYDGVGHNSWDRAYADPALPAWFFSHPAVREDRGSRR